MLRGFVILCVAMLSLAAAPPQKTPTDRPTQTEQNVSASLREIATALNRTNERGDYERDCKQGEDNRRSDLCAQWKAADAAESSARWAEHSFWLAVGGTALGFFTLVAAGFAAFYAGKAAIHTQEGATEARRAADAAERALEHQKQVTAIDLRPWVTIRLVPLALVQTDATISVEIDIITENLGRTVAKNAQLMFKLLYGGDDIHERIAKLWEGWAKERHSSYKVIMPGEAVSFPFWSHHARDGLPWVGAENRAISPVLVASVYYQTEGGNPDVWHQTDRAFTIGRKTDALTQDYIKENDMKLDADQMVARPFSANLAT